MKAHLIITKNENNRRQTLNLLQYYLKKGCKNYKDKYKVFQNYDHPDFDKKLYQNNAGILLLNNFPSDLVTALKPNNEHITVVFTDSNELNSVYNGGYNDYAVYYLSRFEDNVKPKILAKILYYEICFELVLQTDWNDESKANLLEYYNKKIRKETAKLYPSCVTKKQHHITIDDIKKPADFLRLNNQLITSKLTKLKSSLNEQ